MAYLPGTIEKVDTLTIPLHDLDGDGRQYSFELTPTWLTSALQDCDVHGDEDQGPGLAELFAQRNGKEVLVQGTVRADVVAECVRCLGTAHISVQADVATLLSPRPDGGGVELDELEVDPDEPDRDYYSGDTLKLDEIVREYLVLELPTHPLCDEACPGIEIPEHLKAPAELGPTEDNGRALDPRLAPLMKLVSTERDKE